MQAPQQVAHLPQYLQLRFLRHRRQKGLPGGYKKLWRKYRFLFDEPATQQERLSML